MSPIIDYDQETGKLYYTIGEVADHFQVNTSLIRFWEKEFDVLAPKKNKKGNRLFTRVDFNNLKIIFHLVKEKGYTLDGAKKKIQDNRDDIEKTVEIRTSLLKIRQQLEDLKDQL
ncbi:MerR family transcriptional regulator [soil metagenome]